MEEKDFAKMVSMTDTEKQELVCENIQDWLNKEIEVTVGNDKGVPIREKMTILKNLTRLVVCNGFSYNVTGWGVGSEQDRSNPYGMYGLLQHEALSLMNYHSVIVGAMLALGYENDERWFYVNVAERVEKMYLDDLEKFKQEVMASEDDHRKSWFDESHSYPKTPLN